MNQQATQPELYDLTAASKVLGGVSVWTLRAHLKRGDIKPTRLGTRVYLSRAEIERIAREGLPPLPAPNRSVQ